MPLRVADERSNGTAVHLPAPPGNRTSAQDYIKNPQTGDQADDCQERVFYESAQYQSHLTETRHESKIELVLLLKCPSSKTERSRPTALGPATLEGVSSVSAARLGHNCPPRLQPLALSGPEVAAGGSVAFSECGASGAGRQPSIETGVCAASRALISSSSSASLPWSILSTSYMAFVITPPSPSERSALVAVQP